MAAGLLFFLCIPAANASNGYLDFPSFFNSLDSCRVFTEFGMGVFDSQNNFLFSSSVGGRLNSRLTGRLSAPYFSVAKNDRILYGFGDFNVKLTLCAACDSLRTNGVFLRSDINLPSGSRSLKPFAIHSFDGGGGLELRKTISALSLKFAAIHVFVGERNPTGKWPYSNYTVLALSAGFNLWYKAALSFSGYSVDYRKSASRTLLLSKFSGAISEHFRLILCAAAEVGEEDERQYDSAVSIRISYEFPAPKSPGKPILKD